MNEQEMKDLGVLTIDKDNIPTISLDKLMWEEIKKAAQESKWIPPEYMMNDWVSDVCEFLKSGK